MIYPVGEHIIWEKGVSPGEYVVIRNSEEGVEVWICRSGSEEEYSLGRARGVYLRGREIFVGRGFVIHHYPTRVALKVQRILEDIRPELVFEVS